ncbi:AMP-binding protein [Bradyrhizobium sp. 2TAF24]|uniref:AMP-binding protein n=1 Tax=Bradyrhizobium sp. 2TAF24 TaxID=3233011 RepID=UPI003F92B831
MNIAEWLAASARLVPAAPALLGGTKVEADYATFARRAAAIAANLAAQGLAPGDRVALFLFNSTDYLECLYGIWWAGAVAIPINAKLHAREAAWICSNAQAKLAFVDADTAPLLEAARADLPAGLPLITVGSAAYTALRQSLSFAPPVAREIDDLAWLFYTSGTTGRPKGVMLSNGNLLSASLCYLADVDEVHPEDAALYAAPMSHGAGLYNFIHVRRGCRHVVPVSGGFDADEVLTLARELKSVSMFAAPTMVKRLVAAARARGETGEGIKTVVYGGGPMYLEDIKEAMAVLGQRFVQIYGQGESPMTITALSRSCHGETDHPRYLDRLRSVGAAHSAVRVRITGADGEALPSDAVGEIEVKGPPVMLGYWNNPKATAETLVNGWLRTGDVGRLDADGFLTLSDRSKDVIISGGTNIYPREVEEVLLAHPSVAEVSVIGVPDPEWGENVVAYLVLAPGATLDTAALDAHCLANIARFKRPKSYVALAELPKNNYGKVLKTALRELAARPS